MQDNPKKPEQKIDADFIPIPASSNIDPEILFKEGNSLINEGKYEEAIEKMSEALQKAIEKAGNELDYSLAKYYYGYGDAIIAKLAASTEIFGDAIQEAIDKKGAEVVEEIKIPDPNAPKSIEKPLEDEKVPLNPQPAEAPKKQDEQKIQVQQNSLAEEMADDAQIAWETMETARVICEKRMDEVLKINPDINSEQYKEVAKTLARVLMSICELLNMQEKEAEALIECSKALEIRKKIEPKNSRELAEAYFTLGSTTLHFKGKEDEAIKNLKESAKILENCIREILKLPDNTGKEDLKENDQDYIKYDLIKENLFDAKNVKDLKEVLKSVYAKVFFNQKIRFKIDRGCNFTEKRITRIEKNY